jgi:hypothetical protein
MENALVNQHQTVSYLWQGLSNVANVLQVIVEKINSLESRIESMGGNTIEGIHVLFQVL